MIRRSLLVGLALLLTLGVTTPSAGAAASVVPSVVTTPSAGAAAAPGRLAALKARLDALAGPGGAPAPVVAWWVDPAAGVVVLATAGTPRDARAAQWVDRARGLDPAVRVMSDAAPLAPRADLIGGDAIFLGDARCSVGFSARTLAGAPRMITAGHCTQRGGEVRGVSGTTIGPVRSSVFERDGDWGTVDVGPGWRVTPQVAALGPVTLPVTGTATAVVGAPVCRSGSTSGWRCGRVTALDVTANYATGPVGGLTATSACSEGGDSGGPFVSGTAAVGTLSGGSGDCATPGGTSLYQPIEPVLRREGLSLVTG